MSKKIVKKAVKKKPVLTPWDSAEYLKTDEDISAYLDACMEEAGDDAGFIAQALGTVARAKNMAKLSRDTGLSREGLYKSLAADGNPSFAMVLKVAKALNLRLTFANT
jgi:probable addiction module antidote protein